MVRFNELSHLSYSAVPGPSDRSIAVPLLSEVPHPYQQMLVNPSEGFFSLSALKRDEDESPPQTHASTFSSCLK